MSTIEEIESEISKLPAEQLAALRDWFAEFDARVWDRQLEQDVAAGKLDALKEGALRDSRESRCSDL